MKSILDPSFRYTDSASTDIRKTFARIRREQKQAAERQQQQAAAVVTPITKQPRRNP